MKMRIRLTPNASRDEVIGVTEGGVWRVKVQSPPVEGAANKRLLTFLADRLDMSKSAVKIAAGEHSREKTIEIDGDERVVLERMKTGGRH